MFTRTVADGWPWVDNYLTLSLKQRSRKTSLWWCFRTSCRAVGANLERRSGWLLFLKAVCYSFVISKDKGWSNGSLGCFSSESRCWLQRGSYFETTYNTFGIISGHLKSSRLTRTKDRLCMERFWVKHCIADVLPFGEVDVALTLKHLYFLW